MKRSLLFLCLSVLLCFSAPAVRAGDPLLQIQTLPDQNSVKAGMMFLVSAQVVNSSSDSSSEFWANTCSYEKHWVTDNPEVLIQSWTCDENTLEPIVLDPGTAYEKNIMLYIPNAEKTGPVTFRLGFKLMSENGDVAEPLWGDPLTMQVIVPEEVKDAGLVADANVAPVEPAPVTSPEVVETEEAPAVTSPELPAPAKGEGLLFRDPGVPIQVRPGDTFSIALASNPSTGFRWKMTLPEGEKAFTFLDSEHVVSQEVMPGVPGTEVFRFKAVSPGKSEAAFVYERPWETRTAPTRKIFTILVQEN